MNRLETEDEKIDGLTEPQMFILHDGLIRCLLSFAKADGRERHFALFVLTNEGRSDDGMALVSTDLLSSMTQEHLHETLREWLRKETQ